MSIKKIFSFVFENGVMLFLLLMILPFLILAFYVHPSWDDFEYSELAYRHGFFESQRMWYVTWSGRYFSQAVLSSLNPLIFRSISGYKILTFLLIIFFIISVYKLIREIISDSPDRRQILICTLSFVYLFIYGLPTVNLGLFWLASSVIYQLANILMIILIYNYSVFIKNENTSVKNIIIICLLIAAIMGCNEVSMIVTLLFFILNVILDNFINRKLNKNLLLFAVISVISFIIVYLAPGNSYRISTNPQSHNFIFSLKSSAADLIKFIIYRLYNIPLLIFSILFISFYGKHLSGDKFKSDRKIINPIYSLGMYFSLMFAGIFVSYWSLGTSTPYRTLNVIYFVFLAGWFINIIIVMNYIYVRKTFSGFSIPGYAKIILCTAVLISFMKENNIVKAAYKDLIKGTASVFNNELNRRYDLIQSEKSDTVKVDSLSKIPETFFYYDIGENPEGKYNKLQSEYFNKKFIIKK